MREIEEVREIEDALERFADVASLKELYMRAFPGIKNGKQRVVKPREGGLPSFFPIRVYKASLFFTGRVSCCPYCEQRDHQGRDCQTKESAGATRAGRQDTYEDIARDTTDRKRQLTSLCTVP